MAILDRYSEPHRDYFEWQVPNAHGFLCEYVPADKTGAVGILRIISALPSAIPAEDGG